MLSSPATVRLCGGDALPRASSLRNPKARSCDAIQASHKHTTWRAIGVSYRYPFKLEPTLLLVVLLLFFYSHSFFLV